MWNPFKQHHRPPATHDVGKTTVAVTFDFGDVSYAFDGYWIASGLGDVIVRSESVAQDFINGRHPILYDGAFIPRHRVVAYAIKTTVPHEICAC